MGSTRPNAGRADDRRRHADVRLVALAADEDLNVIGSWPAFARFDQRLEAEEEHGPLRAAVMHELDGLLPVGVREHDEGLVVLV